MEVVDGVQRLSALVSFVGRGEFALTGLTYLSDCEGKAYDALPRYLQRRILETWARCHILHCPADAAIRRDLIQRIRGEA